ncbi:hypothetical protein MKX01_002583 [Papaver californicum]|nr:hypothetical protein MKX01_002583 [Papaver californicum]
MVVGLAVPSGPPLGATIEDKLEFFVKFVLLPTFVISSGLRVDIFDLELDDFIIGVHCCGQFCREALGNHAAFPVLQNALPRCILARDNHECPRSIRHRILGIGDRPWGKYLFQERLIFDEYCVFITESYRLINERIYTSLVLSMVTGTISPTVKVLYNPSRRCIAYKRRTIQNCKRNVEFRILASYSPICIYVIHLIQLQGRASPLLVAHKKCPKAGSQFNSSSHIINAFKFYEKQGAGAVSVNSFTAISPYTTMHDDICSIALERRASLIVLPFHHHPAFSSALHLPTSIRKLNQNVLKRAPCSISLLVDRGTSQRAQVSCNVMDKKPAYRVAVNFLGGADDRDALSYGSRMGEDSNVKLTVFRFSNNLEKSNLTPDDDASLDADCIEHFLRYNVGLENIVYREEEVKDSVEIVTVITSIEYSFDLLIVGKDHDGNSSELLRALEESRCNGSILVVQQQPTNDLIHDSP